MDAIREDADTDALTMEIGDASTGSALYASSCGRGQFRGRGGRGRGTARGRGYGRGRGGRYQPYTPRCTHCRMDNHTTEDCGKAPKYQLYTPRCTHCHMDNHTTEECRKAPKSTGNSIGISKSCYYCAESGHLRANCPIRIRAKEAREKEGQKNHNAHASIAMASSDNTPYAFE